MWENKHGLRAVNPWVWAVAGALLLAVAIGIGVLVASFTSKESITQSQDSTSAGTETDAGFGNSIWYEGEEYQLNPNITTVLFLGTDQNEEENTVFVGGGARADAIMLLLIDDSDQSITMLQISRDTIVSVDYYDSQDVYSFSVDTHITLQYAAASSMLRANWLMTNKVSELLYNIPISQTVALSMDGISLLVDAIGGIEITIPADYTDVNPLFVEGETITLDGALAYDYVHYRDTEDFGSNNGRMDRQVQLIRALASKLSGNISAETIEMLQSVASPYMESNLSAEVIEKLSTYTLNDTIYRPEGEDVEGTHDEFYLDETALRALVIQLFYTKVS